MQRLRLSLLIGVMVLPTIAHAQNATGVGVGVAKSRSNSASNAVAISGQGGRGGNARSNATATGNGNSTVNFGATPASTFSAQDINQHGSISNVPNAYAPGLTSAGLETCLGSVSLGASWLGTGLTGGGTIPDAGCSARLDARTLWSFGLKKAAIARLCLRDEIYNSMPEVCQIYLPRYAATPTVAVYPANGYQPASEADYQQYSGGPVEVYDKKGRLRTCNDYDVTERRCRAWSHTASLSRQP